MMGGPAGMTSDPSRPRGALAALRVIVVATASFLGACGSMNVQVDVIDPAYVEAVAQKAQLQSQLREAFRPAEEKDAQFQQIRVDLSDSLKQEVAKYRREGTPQAAASADALENSTPEVLGEFDQLTANLKALDRQIRQQVAEQAVGGPGGADVTTPQLNGLLLQRQATAEAGVDNVLKLLDEIAGGGPTPLVSPTRAAVPGTATRSRLEADLKNLTGGLTLTESAQAYAVASAPEDKWAPRFNRTFGRGTFGNLNFAVKMVDLADFTIKGITFDPTKVAEIASKVTTQSLLLAAQIAGVPVAGLNLGQNDTGSALAAQSAALAGILESNQRLAAQQQLRQEAIVAILTRIAQELNNLRSADENIRVEAHRAIRATYDAYKDLLQYSGQSNGG